MLEELTKPEAFRQAAAPPPAPRPPERSTDSSPVLVVIFGAVCGVLAGAIGAVVLSPALDPSAKVETGYVVGKQWSRTITAERADTVVEEDWQLPQGPQGVRVLSTREVVRSYRPVPDGWVGAADFERLAGRLPGDTGALPIAVEREIGTSAESAPAGPLRQVFRHEPVVETRYRYEVERWERVASWTAEGTDGPPAWPEAPIGPGQREGSRWERLELVLLAPDGGQLRARVEPGEFARVRVGDRVAVRRLYRDGVEAELVRAVEAP